MSVGQLIGWRAGDATESAAAPSTTVLLTQFEDRAGEPALAAAVEEAVARQLGREALIETVPPARVARVLRLMRREPRGRIPSSIGQEVCARDGRIRFLLTGSIHKVQSRYFVDLQAIEPSDGRVRLSLERQAASRHELLSEVEDETARFAADLAIAGPRLGAPVEPLEQVTTASLPALRLYTAAIQAGARRQWGASELLARRAVTADDQFASAYAWAGWSMRQQGRPARDCLPLLERAVALSGATTDRESYFIAATFHRVARNLPAAVAAYEAVLRLQPRDRQALDLLIEAYSEAGRVKEAVELSVARAEHEPNEFYANVRAAHALLLWQGDRDRAARFVRQAEQLAPHGAVADRPVWAAWLSALPVFDAWIAGDSREALGRLPGVERTLDGRLGRERDAFASVVGFSYLALGKRQEAERAFRHAVSPTRQIDLALLALAVGDEASARDWLLQIRAHSAQRPALFARVGLVADAERGLDAAVPSEHGEGIADVTRGLVAVHQGHHRAAIDSLRRGIELLRFSGEPEYFLAVDALARFWMARGKIERAVRLLVDAAAQRARTYGAAHWTGAYWIKVSADLLAAYRRQNRHEEAERLSAVLREVLREADAQHPVARIITPRGR